MVMIGMIAIIAVDHIAEEIGITVDRITERIGMMDIMEKAPMATGEATVTVMATATEIVTAMVVVATATVIIMVVATEETTAVVTDVNTTAIVIVIMANLQI